MRAEPHRTWRLREMAQGIGLTSEHSLRAELGRWIGEGIFQRVSRGLYALDPEWITRDLPQPPSQPA